MSDETLRWVIGGFLALITAGMGYFFIRLDEEVRELRKGMVRVEAGFERHRHKMRRKLEKIERRLPSL